MKDPLENIKYDPLTGRFLKVENKETPKEESPYWTKMGQPKRPSPITPSPPEVSRSPKVPLDDWSAFEHYETWQRNRIPTPRKPTK